MLATQSPKTEENQTSPSLNIFSTPQPPNLTSSISKEDSKDFLDSGDEEDDEEPNNDGCAKRKTPQSRNPSNSSSSDISDKKRRLKYTTEQIAYLEQIYLLDPMPCLQKRQELGKHLGRSARSVQIWFQNKRQKDKKGAPETTNQSAVPSSNAVPPIITNKHINSTAPIPSSSVPTIMHPSATMSPSTPSAVPILSPSNIGSYPQHSCSSHSHSHSSHAQHHHHLLPPPPSTLLSLGTHPMSVPQHFQMPTASIPLHHHIHQNMPPIIKTESFLSPMYPNLSAPNAPSLSIPLYSSPSTTATTTNMATTPTLTAQNQQYIGNSSLVHSPMTMPVQNVKPLAGPKQTFFCEEHRQTLDYRLHDCGCITVQPIKKREHNQTVFHIKKLQIFDWNVQDSESMFEPSNGNLRIVLEKELSLELSWELKFESSLRRISVCPMDIKAVQVKTLSDSPGISALIIQLFRPPRFGVISTFPVASNEESNKSGDTCCDFNSWNVVEDFTTDFIASKFNIHVLYFETDTLLLFLERLKEPLKERLFKIMQENLIEAADTRPYFCYLGEVTSIEKFKKVLPNLLSLESPKTFKQSPEDEEEHKCECGHLDEEHYESEGICNKLQCNCLFFHTSTFSAFSKYLKCKEEE